MTKPRTDLPPDWKQERYPKGEQVAQRWPAYTPLERLLLKLEVDANGCIVFTGKLSAYGYGRLNLNPQVVFAHRAIYEVFVSPIPDGLTLDHLCRNRACCNPLHLEPVTLEENILRGTSLPAINARKTRCPRGHGYTAENTHITRKGYRVCRACRRESSRARRAA